MERIYKVLGKGRRAIHGGHYTYPEECWTERIEAPVLCETGYHVCKREDVLRWLSTGDKVLPFEIWEVECDGLVYDEPEHKGVAERIRLIRKIAVLDEIDLRWLATLFASTALQNTTDARVSDCILTAQKYCVGQATRGKLAAARSATESAVWSARSAAEAAWSAWSARSITESAQAAAWSAWYAAWSAAGPDARSTAEAARAAAWSRNTDILFDYIAAITSH